ncbi:MAG: hypothetical protein L6408_07745 [Nanoarchaeota archaeon]|nr:hypothetical protein [Nanoarchaeota archaeon]
MKAEIITYETKSLDNSKRSIISKRLYGYRDRTNKSRYVYKRQGILEEILHLKITKKTFIVQSEDSKQIKKTIKELGGKVKSWKIDINFKELQKRYG